MPLEIRELVIKVDIQAAKVAGHTDMESRLEKLKSEIMAECLKKVLARVDNLFER